MQIVQTVRDVRILRGKSSGVVGLVPTMGALHEGHLSLVHDAKSRAGEVWVSIFVNPTQFGPKEDFARYPRTLDQDLDACRDAGVDVVFCPSNDEMYPPSVPACEMNVPMMAEDLEGRFRPDHFSGVCRVVAKLFNIVQPHVACFGQKDLQQLRLLEAMVADLNMPIGIIGCPTVREPDGLAMSSRNRYLDEKQRGHALGLYKALLEARNMIEENDAVDPDAIEAAMAFTMKAHHVDVEYAVVRHPKTLTAIDSVEPALLGGVAVLVAGRVGSVRLIDNMLLMHEVQ